MDDRIEAEALEWYGERAGRRRAAAGMSQAALAGRVGIHQSTMSRIENGRIRGIKLVTIARIELELARRRV